VLLAFVRVGINAYLKERLGIPAKGGATLGAPDILENVKRSVDLLELLGGVDDRARLILRDVVLNFNSSSLSVNDDSTLGGEKFLTISEYLQYDLNYSGQISTKFATEHGKAVKRLYLSMNNRDPKSAMHLVNGRNCNVATYEKSWLVTVNFQSSIEKSISQA